MTYVVAAVIAILGILLIAHTAIDPVVIGWVLIICGIALALFAAGLVERLR